MVQQIDINQNDATQSDAVTMLLVELSSIEGGAGF